MRKTALLFLIIIPLLSFSQKTYFQQEVNYVIDVKLNDKNHSLDANIEIEYTNNSPDKLEIIYMHLWPNAYKSPNSSLSKQLLEIGNTSLYYAKDYDRGYIDSLNFKVDGREVKWEFDENHEDIAILYLNVPLSPNEKLKIETPFHVKIPLGKYSRLGHIGQSYQITQWYPKPAVYDHKGWHAMPYLNQGEFYSEFGSFDVSVTLPSNYTVGATGDLVDNKKEEDRLDSLALKTASIETFEKDMAFPPSDSTFKTLRYKQNKVHDFAWFADKRFHVLKGEAELPISKRKVTLWSMFTNAEAKLWTKSIEYLHDAIYYYSLWNGEYPYNQVTAVDGSLSAGAGMEYPNVTVIGSSGNEFILETVIVHEVGHNWFYGILASNERQHPWMDEGLNSFNEMRYITKKYPEKGLFGMNQNRKLLKTFDLDVHTHRTQYDGGYQLSARRNSDQPIELPAEEYSMFNYGAIVYMKSAVVFGFLKAYLGDEIFDKCMMTYYERWKFKHPYPEDLRAVFEEVSGKNLDWFFNDIIQTTKKIDYKLKSIEKISSEEYSVLIENKGMIACPFPIHAIGENNKVETFWTEGFEGKQNIKIPVAYAERFIIDLPIDLPEINRHNNQMKSEGIFKRGMPYRLQFLGSYENPRKKHIYFIPTVGYNVHNGIMPGIGFYNIALPQKKAEYALFPMYSFQSKKVTGYGDIGYNIFPYNKEIQKIRFGLHAASFQYSEARLRNESSDRNYLKIAPYLTLDFNRRKARSSINHSLTFRHVNMNFFGKYVKRLDYDNIVGFPNVVLANDNENNYYVNEVKYDFENNQRIHPFTFNASLQQSDKFIKLSVEGNYTLEYPGKKRGLDIRLFAGQFIYNNLADPMFNFGMSGNTDYTYDYVYAARNHNTGALSRQLINNDGGFKNPTDIPFAGNFLVASNIMVSSPLKYLPIGWYFDAGFAGQRTIAGTIDNNLDVAWNTGIALRIIPKFFEIYFPISSSADLNMLSYSEKIRFTLQLHELRPFEKLRKFSL
jgi:hypothetical protein